MPNKQKQRVTEELAKPTSSSNRQSYDRNNPTDIHTRPIDFLTEQEVTKLTSGTKGSRNAERDAVSLSRSCDPQPSPTCTQ